MNAPADIVLVDGSSYLYRAFHALPPLTNSAGEPTGALLGVLNMLLKFLKEQPSPRIAVVFDAPGKTFRDDLYAQYKAHRPPMPDELRAQTAPLMDAVRALGLPMLRVAGVEADDVIGTLAKRSVERGWRVLISTGDKDMAQLVDGHVSLINTMTHSVLDRAGVKAKFDVYPEQMIDYLALVGDSSDNIPGIDKVGPKTAAKWLDRYRSLDGIIESAGEIEGKVGENLRAGLDTLALSRQLATIRTDVELTERPEDLVRGEPDADGLRAIYTRYELRQLLRQLDGSGADDAAGAAARVPSAPRILSSPADSSPDAPALAPQQGPRVGVEGLELGARQQAQHRRPARRRQAAPPLQRAGRSERQPVAGAQAASIQPAETAAQDGGTGAEHGRQRNAAVDRQHPEPPGLRPLQAQLLPGHHATAQVRRLQPALDAHLEGRALQGEPGVSRAAQSHAPGAQLDGGRAGRVAQQRIGALQREGVHGAPAADAEVAQALATQVLDRAHRSDLQQLKHGLRARSARCRPAATSRGAQGGHRTAAACTGR